MGISTYSENNFLLLLQQCDAPSRDRDMDLDMSLKDPETQKKTRVVAEGTVGIGFHDFS